MLLRQGTSVVAKKWCNIMKELHIFDNRKVKLLDILLLGRTRPSMSSLVAHMVWHLSLMLDRIMGEQAN